jgi:hypothetical protein
MPNKASELGKDRSAAEELKAHTRTLEVLIPEVDDRSWWPKLIETLGAVIAPVAGYSAVGATLIIWAIVHLHHELREIVVHLGGAFIVAGIVAFGLEWGREVRHVRTLTAMLVNMLWKYKNDIIDAPLKDSIKNGMLALMHDNEQQIAEQSPRFGAHVGELVSRGGWASEAFRTFLREFHTQMTERAGHLATIGGSLARGTYEAAADERVDMPDAITLADVLVANIVSELLKHQNRQDAECLNVSDMYTWTTLSRLRGIQKDAAMRIKLKRVFVLGLSSDQHVTAEEAYNILSEHFSWTVSSNYEMRLMLLENYQQLPLFELNEAKHFGIFKPSRAVGRPVAVLVRDEGISKMRLVAAPEAMLSEFEMLWSRAEQVNAPPDLSSSNTHVAGPVPRASDVVINDFILAYFIRRMPNDGDYKGISTLSGWIEGRYLVFGRAARKSFARKGVHAKRVFVLDVPLDSDHVVEFLRQQEKQRRDTASNYEWRLCNSTDLEGEIANAIPVGYYESASADDPSKVVVERAQPTRQFFQTTLDENHLLDASFTKLWKKCREPREVVKELALHRVEDIFGE